MDGCHQCGRELPEIILRLRVAPAGEKAGYALWRDKRKGPDISTGRAQKTGFAPVTSIVVPAM
jgi:hypothetical protein